MQILSANAAGVAEIELTTYAGKSHPKSSAHMTSRFLPAKYERHDYAKQVKKSGLFSGGGLGFTIGTEKRKDWYKDADRLQKSSTMGSVSGNVSIESDNKVEIGASAVLAGYED